MVSAPRLRWATLVVACALALSACGGVAVEQVAETAAVDAPDVATTAPLSASTSLPAVTETPPTVQPSEPAPVDPVPVEVTAEARPEPVAVELAETDPEPAQAATAGETVEPASTAAPTIAPTTEPTTVPTPLPERPTPVPPTPEPAPILVPELAGQFTTIGGGQIDLGSLQGQDVVLWFWAPW